MLEWSIFQDYEENIPSAEKNNTYMKAKLILIGKKTKDIFSWKTQKPKPQKIVIFQLHQYPIYHFGTIFKI